LGNPVELMLTPGQDHDLTCAESLIENADPEAYRQRPLLVVAPTEPLALASDSPQAARTCAGDQAIKREFKLEDEADGLDETNLSPTDTPKLTIGDYVVLLQKSPSAAQTSTRTRSKKIRR
jgi:hypothetical protein